MPGCHLLICAVEVQDEAGQQTWGQKGQDSVLMAPSSIWDLQAGGCGAGSFGATRRRASRAPFLAVCWPETPSKQTSMSLWKKNARIPRRSRKRTSQQVANQSGGRKNDRALGDPHEWRLLPRGPGHPPVL